MQAAVYQPQQTQGNVACCLCGIPIQPNPSNMCVACLRSQVDVTEGLQKHITVYYCKTCGGYLQPPHNWIVAELESKELLTFCIKRIKGLSKVKLVDANFIWTEPHSKRLKVKVTVQGDVMNGAILQQSCVIEYNIVWNMCPACNRANTNVDQWVAKAQVRQHVPHKRTFLYLEQLLIKHHVDQNCVSIKHVHQGLDFFFSNRSHAVRFVDFLTNTIPCRHRSDKQLVSHDTHSNTYNYKYTFSVEIVPVCKDDLIWLPQKLSNSMGCIGPLVLCTKVASFIQLIDTNTCQYHNTDANTYWRSPFPPLLNAKQLVEFIVLDIEVGQKHQDKRWTNADVQLARMTDFGVNDITYWARTHLGHVLQTGDLVWAYDLTRANLTDSNLESAVQHGLQLPDVIIVRKSYSQKRNRRKQKGYSRAWKLKHLDMEMEPAAGGGKSKKALDVKEREMEMDRERFYEELEEDADMRSRIDIFKADQDRQRGRRQPTPSPSQPAQPSHPASSSFAVLNHVDEHGQMVPSSQFVDAALAVQGGDMCTGDDDESDDGSVPEVPLEELLDDLEGMQIDDGPAGGAGGAVQGGEGDEGDLQGHMEQ